MKTKSSSAVTTQSQSLSKNEIVRYLSQKKHFVTNLNSLNSSQPSLVCNELRNLLKDAVKKVKSQRTSCSRLICSLFNETVFQGTVIYVFEVERKHKFE